MHGLRDLTTPCPNLICRGGLLKEIPASRTRCAGASLLASTFIAPQHELFSYDMRDLLPKISAFAGQAGNMDVLGENRAYLVPETK
jgi:hypothetical protein